ncbi:class I adenylate-forming enzyme family protein [Streptomyces sp. NPDC050416]|uniref:class I adenylate-forming enzyme family protein n=1 Tax=Streptomyces sp. NPDC050416 TaxID=3365611 RepID=UPI0037B6178D
MNELIATLHAVCQERADQPALTFEGQSLTYREFWDRVERMAAAYQRLGIQAEDRVVCQLPNSPEYLISMVAAWISRIVFVGVDHDLTGPELVSLVDRTDAVALLYQPRAGADDGMEPLRTVHEAFPKIHTIVRGTDEPVGTTFADLLDDSADLPDTPRDYTGIDDLGIALLLMTSGTTGQPKLVVETCRALWSKTAAFLEAMRPNSDDVWLIYPPMAHGFGLKMTLMGLASGGRLVVMDRFSPSGALDLVTAERVTVLPGTPAHLRMMLDRLDGERHDVSSLRWGVSAASPLPAALLEQVYAVLGVEMLFIYGCSEGFYTFTTDRADIEAGSVGRRPMDGPAGTPADGHVEIAALDGTGSVASGVLGEIVYRAKVPVRYWGQESVGVDGWYHTGDLGIIDDEGRLHVRGRTKELVNRGGLKVSCVEVETALGALPAVADAAIFPVPDQVLGEAIGACVVSADPDAPIDLEGLKAALRTSLARHKMPDRLWIVDAIPRTKLGKIDRAALSTTVAS